MKQVYIKEYSNFHSLTHIFLGMLTCKFPFLWYLLIIPYQLTQYMFNCRVFLNKMIILKNNSIHHTLYKLLEHTLGMITSFFILILKHMVGL